MRFRNLYRLRQMSFALLLGLLLPACSPHRFFYYPNRVLYLDPEKLGFSYKLVTYPSLNGKNLTALLFETNREPKGTVVHCHGNYANVSNHFLASRWLVEYGYDVLIFDYQGYGGSEGKPSPRRTVEDGIASVRWARDNSRARNRDVFIFGQSLGGAVGSAVMAKEPWVRAAVIEAAFSSYPSIARDVLGRSAWTWLLYPFYPPFTATRLSPIRQVAKISPRPVLFIHGTADDVVPHRMSELLFQRAKEPKELWLIPGAGHMRCRVTARDEYEKRITAFLDAARTPQNVRPTESDTSR